MYRKLSRMLNFSAIKVLSYRFWRNVLRCRTSSTEVKFWHCPSHKCHRIRAFFRQNHYKDWKISALQRAHALRKRIQSNIKCLKFYIPTLFFIGTFSLKDGVCLQHEKYFPAQSAVAQKCNVSGTVSNAVTKKNCFLSFIITVGHIESRVILKLDTEAHGAEKVFWFPFCH